jgi:hypothetical protein
VEFNWVHSALRPPIGLLCQPRMIMMKEKLVEWWLAEETEVLGENLPHCRFVHQNPSHAVRTAAVRSQRLTAWATARPNVGLNQTSIHSTDIPSSENKSLFFLSVYIVTCRQKAGILEPAYTEQLSTFPPQRRTTAGTLRDNEGIGTVIGVPYPVLR